MIPEMTEQILFCTFDDCVKADWLGLLICPLLTLPIEDQFILYMYLRKTYYIFISRYQGHCPTTKYDYGETYGEATTKYFQDYRSRVLSASADPYCKGGDFPTYYTHRPETVISNRARNRDRWLLAPKYSLTNIDFDRKEELKHFDKVILIPTTV